MTATQTPIAAGTATVDTHHARRWWILGVLALAQLMVVLDSTVVNIALPHAQSDLHFSNGDRQWIVTAYSLAFGSLLLLGGRLADIYGRKRVFLVGVIGFAGASAIGGASVNFGMLVAARAVQGAFGALLAPAALSLLTTTFTHPEERGKAFGIYGGIAAAGASVGLLLGGVLTEYLNWRWTMYVNVLIAVAATAGGVALLAPHAAELRQRIDRIGTVLACGGMFAIVYGFAHAATKSGSVGWTDPQTIGFLVAGVVLLAAFVLVERRVKHPLLPLRVITDRNRGGAYGAMFLASVGMFGVFLFLTYYLETILGYSPVKTGLAFLPLTGAVLVSSGVANTVLMKRVSPRAMIPAGLLIAAGGMALLTRIGLDSSYASTILPSLLLVAIGPWPGVRTVLQPRHARRRRQRCRGRVGNGQRFPADRRLDRDRAAQQHCDKCRRDVHRRPCQRPAVVGAHSTGIGAQLRRRVLGRRGDLRDRSAGHLPAAAAGPARPFRQRGPGSGSSTRVSTSSKPRRLRADAARNRQALIDAAQRLFTARGLGVTLDDIAAEAGVNVATAYRHFANKHELVRAFVGQIIVQAATIAEETAAVEDPWQALSEFIRRMLDLMVSNRGLHDVFTPGLADDWLDRLDEHIDPIVRGLIERAQAAGAVRDEIEPGDLGVILQMLATVSDIPTDDHEALRGRYLALVLSGLRPSATPLPGTAPSPQQTRSASR